MTMHGSIAVLRWFTVFALGVGVAFLFAPTDAAVAPVAIGMSADSVAGGALARASADSLTEDIILYNLFTPSRSAPSRRFSAASGAAGQDIATDAPIGDGFRPELIGTAVSDTPGETRALLRLLASDAAPRLYAVGDKAGGYSVVSIDARSVVLTGPRGRVVLRLPENEENHS